ncbi:MAG: hypothetical protein H6R15_909 [Proteobacteria bacterium]|nr:hypothetical protein [Pseudomonadota bacterium]
MITVAVAPTVVIALTVAISPMHAGIPVRGIVDNAT